jgi:hypothetical protein
VVNDVGRWAEVDANEGGNSLLLWIALWGFSLSARKCIALLLFLYTAHYLVLSEFSEILLVHIVFRTGSLLLGAVRLR